MKVTKIVFSPTGGTDRVADILAKALGDEVVTVDLCDPKADFSKETVGDLAVIAMPCFGGRVPPIAAARFATMKGDDTAAVVVGVYGDRAFDDVILETADLAKDAGFHVIAGVAAVAEHSIVRDFAAHRPDDADRATLRVFAAQIATKFNAGDFSAVELPGNRPYKEYKVGAMVPEASDACIKCGKCARLCPTNAISTDDLQHGDANRCMACMRCIAVCPVQARALDSQRYNGVAQMLKGQGADVRKEVVLYL